MDDSLQFVNLDTPGGSTQQSGDHGQDGGVYLAQTAGGGRYVTIIQDGQTYAIPAADYATMMEQPGVQEAAKDLNRVEFKQEDANTEQFLEPVLSTQTKIPELKSSTATPTLTTLTPVQSVPNIAAPAPAPQSSASKQPLKQLKPITAAPAVKKKIFTSDAPRKHLYPTMQEVVKKLPSNSSPVKKNYKPIRVDNWGIFLLSRLQAYFQKKEYCDLTLRFPEKNAQIKVHKLVMNACTDFFSQYEKDGKIVDNALDMPANFTPESVAPIIRFMYTGKMELKETSYNNLRETAETLQMSVLTKLMDAQVNTVDTDTAAADKKPAKRHSSGAFDDDPVEQMRKIRRIERKVALEGKKNTKVYDTSVARLPGKKLPIWKKRTTSTQAVQSVSHVADKVPAAATDDLQTFNKTSSDIEKKCVDSKAGQLLPSPIVAATYKRRSPGEKPKIPRRLQEIQQHLMFEKVLKSGTKNTLMKKDSASESKQLSMEEVKELVEEQKQRSANIANEYEEEDDYDYNEDTLGIGDDYIDNVDSPAPVEQQHLDDEESKAFEQSTVVPEPEPLKKTTRFSLNPLPDNIPTQEIIRSEEEVLKNNIVLNIAAQTTSAPAAKKSPLQDAVTDLDEALEEFSRVAEEEAEELSQEERECLPASMPVIDPKKPRRGRPPRWLAEQTLQMGAEARKKQNKPGPSSSAHSIDLKKEAVTTVPSAVVMRDTGGSQTQLINEVLKKYPNLIKNNKAVKIKVMTKDTTGKNVTKFITLKSQTDETSQSLDSTADDPPVGGFRPVQKVVYTGKRGRPKKVKAGDIDPHQEERKKINARLKRDFPQLASQITGKVEENEEEATEETLEQIPIGEDLDQVDNTQTDKVKDSTETDGVSQNMSYQQGSSGQFLNEVASMNSINPLQPTQTFLMENGQIIMTPTSQLINSGQVAQPSSQGTEMIQLITTDGQILTTVPKARLGSNFNILNPQQQQPQVVNPMNLQPVINPSQTFNIINTGNMSTPGSVALVNPMSQTSLSTSQMQQLIPVSNNMMPSTSQQVIDQQNNLPDDKVVNKIVNDWDSEEETK